MSLVTLKCLLAERQRLRPAHRELQAHATEPNFAEKVDALDAKIDALDRQCTELLETLVAEDVVIPDLVLYDLARLALERQERRHPRSIATRLRLALDTARSMK